MCQGYRQLTLGCVCVCGGGGVGEEQECCMCQGFRLSTLQVKAVSLVFMSGFTPTLQETLVQEVSDPIVVSGIRAQYLSGMEVGCAEGVGAR